MNAKHHFQEKERKPWGLYALAAFLIAVLLGFGGCIAAPLMGFHYPTNDPEAAFLIAVLLGFGGCIAAPLMGFHYPTNDPETQRLLEDSDSAIQESEEFNENAQELIEFLDTHRTLEDF